VTKGCRQVDFCGYMGAGIAVEVKLIFTPGKVQFSGPNTGYPSDETGKIVTENIHRISKGETRLKEKALG
ncbi:MAG: NAD(FAD)-dependent dehydrogenase, partial [Christiangramia sp.]|nr:NAD(FAD)-dependent dehydrogenase [Christiangramia sp.]